MDKEKMVITSKGMELYDELAKIDRDIKTLNLERRDSLHLRLLAEETLGMLKLMAGDFTSLLWIEKDDKEARIHLVAKTEDMDIDTKKELIAVSTSGKNAKAKGLMGKIGEVFENSLLHYENIVELEREYGVGTIDPAAAGSMSTDYMTAWTLEQYRMSMRQEDVDRDFAWSEEESEPNDIFEKSIVGSIAKNVIVGVKKEDVEMTIIMDLKGE
ncbi:MAG: hypothetical protein II497_03490 [Lachnospiraceae bacterium]|nr:hypothetical protein [Lachnospiraceae bacterium]MBQ4241966.1 hypothetical protein [Lachnospiraceae bacterium]